MDWFVERALNNIIGSILWLFFPTRGKSAEKNFQNLMENSFQNCLAWSWKLRANLVFQSETVDAWGRELSHLFVFLEFFGEQDI